MSGPAAAAGAPAGDAALELEPLEAAGAGMTSRAIVGSDGVVFASAWALHGANVRLCIPFDSVETVAPGRSVSRELGAGSAAGARDTDAGARAIAGRSEGVGRTCTVGLA